MKSPTVFLGEMTNLDERVLQASVRSTIALLENIEKTFTAMPVR